VPRGGVEKERAMPELLSIPPATTADYARLAAVGRAAFEADKQAYGQGPRIYEDPSFLLPLLEKNDGAVRKLTIGREIVGVAITYEKAPERRRLGCLCLLPAWQGRGYGAEALRLLEAEYPAAALWEVDTPADSARNLHFYRKVGYRVVGKVEGSERPELALLEKRISRPVNAE
jgi:ribosomal protein S18 acetylase RimI-like enzyme